MTNVPTKWEMMESLKLFGQEEPETKRPLNFKVIKTIKKSAPEVQSYVEKHTNSDKIVIGGSSAMYSQLTPKSWGKRTIKDLDIYSSHVLKLKNALINILSQKYKNITTGRLQIRGGHYLVQISINGMSAVEIHHSIKAGTKIHVFNDELHYAFKTQDPLRIGKLRYIRIGTILAQKSKAIQENFYFPNPQTGQRERITKDSTDYHKIVKSLARGRPIPKEKSINFGNFMGLGDF
jgi:hypothetical protein